jgi:hypothetical protein
VQSARDKKGRIAGFDEDVVAGVAVGEQGGNSPKGGIVACVGNKSGSD